MRLAVDCDGVLADWNTAFLHLLQQTSGRYLGPILPFGRSHLPDTWDWPEALGYTKKEINAAWDETRKGCWWEYLAPLPGACDFLMRINDVANDDPAWEVYFVTSRGGRGRPAGDIKRQTEEWLDARGMACPTVIVRAAHKGDVCHALGLDALIDDKPSHLHAALRACGPTFRAFLKAAPYNVEPLDPAVTTLHSLDEFWGYV
jgi:hypothetical protein